MTLQEKYEIVLEKFKQIDFSALWPGFHQYDFALYDTTQACINGIIIDKPQEFIANTAIVYKDKYIGIWNMLEEIDLDILTSKLVHETFHAFQKENNEQHFVDEMEALRKYTYQEDNLSIITRENNLICLLLRDNKDRYLHELLNLRLIRKVKYPYEYTYQSAIEQIEGTANFVELLALKMLDKNKYENSLLQMQNELINPANLFPIRIISYNIGALFLLILKKMNMDINYTFSSEFFFDSTLNNCQRMPYMVNENKMIGGLLKAFHHETKEIIKKHKTKENIVLNGKYPLRGVNIYDARFLDDYIITTYFLMYEDNKEPQCLYGDYLVKLYHDTLMIKTVYQIKK